MSRSAGEDQVEMFDESALPAGIELLLTREAQVGRYTGERIARNIERKAAIIAAIAEGMPITSIARAYRCSPSTVYALMQSDQGAIEREKKVLASKWALVSHMCAERLIDGGVASMPAQNLAISGCMAASKRQELLGEASSIVEHRRAHPSLDELRSRLLVDVEAEVLQEPVEPGRLYVKKDDGAAGDQAAGDQALACDRGATGDRAAGARALAATSDPILGAAGDQAASDQRSDAKGENPQ